MTRRRRGNEIATRLSRDLAKDLANAQGFARLSSDPVNDLSNSRDPANDLANAIAFARQSSDLANNLPNSD